MNIAYFVVAKTIGGIETYLQNIKSENASFFISEDSKDYYRENISSKIFFVEFTKIKGIIQLFRQKCCLKSLDIIHANDLITFFYAYLVLKFINRKIKIVVTIHSILSEHQIFSQIVQKILICLFSKLVKNKNIRIIAVSNYCKSDLIKLGIPKGKIDVIYHGLLFPNEITKISNPKSYSFVGRLSYEKGFDIFLNLTKNIKLLEATVIGSTTYENDMDNLKQVWPNISFLGKLKRDILYNNVEIVCITSRTESFCFVLLEALIKKKIVFSLQLPIISELLDKTPILKDLIMCLDINNMANKINNVDVNAWIIAYEKEYLILKEMYSVDNSINKTKNVYKDILN